MTTSRGSVLAMTNPRRSQVCHEYCLDVHAKASASENWSEDQDPTGEVWTSLSLYAENIPVRWDTVTPGSSFQAWEDMIEDVAIDYLLSGDVECQQV